MNDIILNDLIKHTFGVHNLVNQVSRLRHSNHAFPPYNIIVDNPAKPSNYTLEMAVAGFSKDNVNVRVTKEQGAPVLVIEGSKNNEPDCAPENYIVRGLGARSFRRDFTMADSVRVDSVELADGILRIKLSTIEQDNDDLYFKIK